MPKITLDWRNWLYHLMSGAISGGAGAVIASLAAMGITPETYNLSTHLGKTLKMFAACFILNAVINIFMELRKTPLPDVEPVKDTNSNENVPSNTLPPPSAPAP